jgi:DNA-binding MarR family transcriptional regulator
MDTTVELVNKWADYHAAHPGGGIDEFCHFHIISNREANTNKTFLGGNVPPDVYSMMAKLIGRLSKLHNSYALMALKEAGVNSMDEFLYLNSIKNSILPRKTEVINNNFNELSSGLLILGRIKEKGLLKEEADTTDKRSKRLTLTKKGEVALKHCYKNMAIINAYFFSEVPAADIQLCVQLLTGLETKFASKWQADKVKTYTMLLKENQ